MAKNYEGRKENGEGNVRKLPSGKYECVVQSKYINPKTGKPKRTKRVGETEKAVREKAKMDLTAWEKEIERDRDTKINCTCANDKIITIEPSVLNIPSCQRLMIILPYQSFSMKF